MKYPEIGGKKIDVVNQHRFDKFYVVILKTLKFDNEENQLELTDSVLELLAWNCATELLFS